MRPGSKIVTSPRTMWATWTDATGDADYGPVVAWLLDGDALLVPLVCGIEDATAQPLPTDAHVSLHDDRAQAEQAWRDLMREATA